MPSPITQDDREIEEEGSEVGEETNKATGPSDEMGYWAEITRKVEKIDQAKIKRVKEDMDIVLIFAGLFSAVLTTLITASFSNLQEDNSATTVQLLRLMVSSQHNVTASGDDSPDLSAALNPQPFSPPASAICVNVLWFTSLVTTLSTASFGFLVQQWLRKYPDIDNDNPLARLRIREFRHEGLLSWKVFEIASSLPLLLQFALFLFYAGLCVYTLTVHPSVGWTTIPLVIVWAFLFAITTLSPLVSSRCPYRTTLLPQTLERLRKILLSRPRASTKWIREIRNLPSKGTGDEFFGFGPGSGAVWEEDEVALSSQRDLGVLYSDDVIRLYREALYTAKLGIILQKRTPVDAIFKFFLKAIEFHLPPLPSSAGDAPAVLDRADNHVTANRNNTSADPPLIDHRRLLDLTPLPQPVGEGLSRAAIAFVQKYGFDRVGFKGRGSRPLYMIRAILVLFAKSHRSKTTDEALDKLQAKLLNPTQENHLDICRILAHADFPRIWSVVERASTHFNTADKGIVVRNILEQRRPRNLPGTRHTQFNENIIDYVTDKTRRLPGSELDGISYVLEAEVRDHQKNLKVKQWDTSSVASLKTILSVAETKYSRAGNAAYHTVFSVLSNPHLAPTCSELDHDVTLRLLQSFSRYLYPEDNFVKANSDERKLILECLSKLVERHIGIAERFDPSVDLIRLISRLVWMMKGTKREAKDHHHEWNSLWGALSGATSYYCSTILWGDSESDLSRWLRFTDFKDSIDDFLALSDDPSVSLILPAELTETLKENRDRIDAEIARHKEGQEPPSQSPLHPVFEMFRTISEFFENYVGKITEIRVPSADGTPGREHATHAPGEAVELQTLAVPRQDISNHSRSTNVSELSGYVSDDYTSEGAGPSRLPWHSSRSRSSHVTGGSDNV
ncbi:hypothetical protein NM688_g1284 [Phlebia brevispora]|uniref:Uncharacterized protein n=1 Tax=Phlebia brevispora TaxID=194682 RepID=A0ACC1TC60_9APHY|nr:hypothetical protein NM688_g1284 [Phlebia brevispora]